MAQVSQIRADALHWVGDELAKTLRRIGQLIESYIESPRGQAPLQRALADITQVSGTLTMIRCFGAGVLADEIKCVLRDLLDERITDESETALAAVLSAIIQLSDYLDLLSRGMPDCVLVFQPLINELRVSRGVDVATEVDLFLRQSEPARPTPARLPASLSEREPDQIIPVAKRFYPVFQTALLGWLQNTDSELNLRRLGKIAEQLHGLAATPAVYELWWLYAAVIEGVLIGGIEATAPVKRLSGRMVQSLKNLGGSSSEQAFVESDELYCRLLFQVQRSHSGGNREIAVRQAYAVVDLLPEEATLTEWRERLRGPNTGLIGKLSEALREDLAAVRDGVDLAVRAGRDNVNIAELVDLCTRVCNTLAMLGLNELRRRLLSEIEILDDVTVEDGIEDDGWAELATALVDIEQQLDYALTRQLRNAGNADAKEDGAAAPQAREFFDAGTAAIYRESLNNVARLKQLLNAYLETGDAGPVTESDHIVHEIEAGLGILGNSKGEAAVARLRGLLDAAVPYFRTNADLSNTVAECISALEWYLNGLTSHGAGGAPAPAAMDEHLNSLAELLEAAGPAPAESDTATPGELPTEVSDRDLDEVDPEIRDIFIEEAAEVLTELRRLVPGWAAQPDSHDLLTVIRRSFHTLKGSGRLVGAAEIGEFCWSIEQLLNQCLEGAREVNREIVSMVEQALALLPGLIDAFREQRPAEDDAVALAQTAEMLVTGREAADASPDAELIEVFCKDAYSRLHVVEECLDEQAEQRPDLSSLMRALHTIRGSAESAGVAPIAAATGALEECLQHTINAGLGLTEDVSSVIVDWVSFMHAALEALADAGPLPDNAALLSRVEALETSLPQGADADAERELIRTFTEEALDLLEQCEGHLDAWYAAPDDRHHPETIASMMDTLTERAMHARVEIFVQAGRAISGRLWFNLNHPEAADPAVIHTLHDVLDRLYDYLDRLRFGERVDDAQEIISLVGPIPNSVAEEGFGDEPSAMEAGDEHPLPDADEPINVSNDQPVGEIPDRMEDEPEQKEAADAQVAAVTAEENAAPDVDERSMSSPDAISEEDLPNETYDDTDPADSADPAVENVAAIASVGEAGADPELLSIFCEEAIELLEAIDAAVSDWEKDAAQSEPRQAIQRALHTLKGSARMARVTVMGDISHDLESFIAALEVRDRPVDQADIGAVRRVVDLTQEAIERVAHDGVADDTGTLRALRAKAYQVLAAASPASLDEAMSPPPVEAPVEQEITPATPVATSLTIASDGPQSGSSEWAEQLFWQPSEDLVTLSHSANETARVLVDSLDAMSNESGEISIFRSRLEQENAALRFQLKEMAQTIARVNEQVRKLDAQTESSILSRHAAGTTDDGEDRYAAEFDPLEFDRYTRMQELSRALSESLNDLSSLHGLMGQNTRETESLLLQQSRVNTSLHQRLMRALMIPFSRHSNRLQRLVRQTAEEYQRDVRLHVSGDTQELDRNVLQRILGPIEHMLRNAVVHGIESAERRREWGKPEQGCIDLTLGREGSQLVITLADDGNGLDLEAIRHKAEERGLLNEGEAVDEEILSELIFERGFTTAPNLTQAAGRGVGMDVVRSEIKQLGGSIHVNSQAGQGVQFEIRLPISLAVSQALIIRAGQETYAVPLRSVSGIIRIDREQWAKLANRPGATFSYGDENYAVGYIGELIGIPRPDPERLPSHISMLLIRVGEHRAAIAVDQALGGRDIVMKSVGPQVSTVAGVNGATIMPDGSVVLILNVAALLGELSRHGGLEAAVTTPSQVEEPAVEDARPLILVVDDSITVRRVSERFLVRNDYRVLTARDGMDALAKLQAEPPALVLLDIEMPRIDGFEVATYIRNTARLREVPIVMLTSRSGDKHRQRARQIGVNRYLIKPYQEEELLSEISKLLSDSTVEELS